MAPVVSALAASTLVVDCTVEGLMHAPELPAILGGGARVIYVSNEHPEALARLQPNDQLEPLVKDHIKRLRSARRMRVSSAAGTELDITLAGATCGGNWGYTTRPGTMTHWPGGLALAFPAANSVNGTLVLAEGDVNLTFKRYIERPITLRIENDYVTSIEGKGVDADLMRSYIAAWGDREAYAVSHVGYGLNAAARWDSMALYDKRDFNGTELRAFAGNFLYSTGANEVAGRYSAATSICRCATARSSWMARSWSMPARWWHEPSRRSPCWAAGRRCSCCTASAAATWPSRRRWKRWRPRAFGRSPGICRATATARPSSPTTSRAWRKAASP